MGIINIPQFFDEMSGNCSLHSLSFDNFLPRAPFRLRGQPRARCDCAGQTEIFSTKVNLCISVKADRQYPLSYFPFLSLWFRYIFTVFRINPKR
uniref:Clathrin heavy chain n=1 Tax=Parascaris univalens TaxID=6257 RepID=A0A915BZS2_PARUN